MTKGQLIKLLEQYPDSQEIVVPSPEEPGGPTGVAITRLVLMKNGKVKLSIMNTPERETAEISLLG